MIDWWNSLPFEQMVYYAIGIIALVMVTIHLLLALVGVGGDGADAGFDPEIGDVDHGGGIGFLSSQTIAAFFTAFGWVGVAASKQGLNSLFVAVLAMTGGVISMAAMYYILRSMLRLQSKGNLNYENAVGQEAVVYVTIPGSDKDGGQIEITIQGRMRTAPARSIAPGELKSGQRVRVTGMLGPTSYIVEDINAAAAESTPAETEA